MLNTAEGVPAAGMKLELFAIDEEGVPARLKTVTTNADGRTDEPLLEGASFRPGYYTLVFHVRAYFGERTDSPDPLPFLLEVPVHFGVSDAEANYHVPLLVSPWSYSTYRGS